MLDPRFIEENLEAVAENCRNRNVEIDVSEAVSASKARREAQGELDAARKRQNEVAKLVKAAKSQDERMPLIEEGKALKSRVAELEEAHRAAGEKADALLGRIPNMTHPDSPVGRTEEENRVVRVVGEPRTFDFQPLDHVELGEKLDLIDFDAGAEVTGASFYFLKNEAVFLEMALCQYAMRKLVARGYTPHLTPDLARNEVLAGTGYIPRGEETQIYSIEGADLSLIATAEITLAGLLANKILDAGALPLRLAGLSHCFRTEAGAHGRASRGLYRVHQFTKVEMFAFTAPEDSEALHAELLAIEEEIFQELGIPYRVVDICTGDLGGPAYRKYDLEAWMPTRGEKGDWGEVTSASNCTDFQARRLRARFRREEGARPEFVHSLNGTAVAISRAMIVLLENHQNADGSIDLPDCLKPYLPFERIEPRG